MNTDLTLGENGTRMFRLTCLATIVAVISGLTQMAEAENLKRLSDVAFHDFEAIIAELEGSEQPKAIGGEIAVAKKLVTHGKLLLRAGRTKKAAVFAERLQFQIELIRAMIAASDAIQELHRTEDAILNMEMQLKMLKSRMNRLRLEVEGAKVTGAFPALSGGE